MNGTAIGYSAEAAVHKVRPEQQATNLAEEHCSKAFGFVGLR
jgi:hypothetical protein